MRRRLWSEAARTQCSDQPIVRLDEPTGTCCRGGDGGCARKLWGEVVASVVDEPSVDSGRRASRVAVIEVLAEHTYGVPRLLEVLGKVPAPAQTGTLMQHATCSIRHATCTTQHALLHRTCRAVRRQPALSDGTAPRCVLRFGTDIGRQGQ